MTIPATQSALNGVLQGMQNLQKTSAEIARAPQSEADLTRSLVQLGQDKLQVEASLKALKSSHDTLGTLLDLKV